MTAKTAANMNAAEFMAHYTDAKVARLSAVFDLVKNRDHWKNAVDAVIPQFLATPDELAEAVAFYTGSVATVETCEVYMPAPGGMVPLRWPAFHVKAAGYFATCGA